jgi:anti-sigma regulatory factor (Ser/Thr protein kinase)
VIVRAGGARTPAARNGGNDSPREAPARAEFRPDSSGRIITDGASVVTFNAIGKTTRTTVVQIQKRLCVGVRNWLRTGLVWHSSSWVPELNRYGDREGAQVIDEHPSPVALQYRWSFAPELVAPGDARQRLAPVLGAWGLSGQQSADALLLMSELVSNAVEHARTPLELRVSFTGISVLIEVSDDSQAGPELRPKDSSELRGRGLQFVDALARAWSWRPNGNGKTVWAEITVGEPNRS